MCECLCACYYIHLYTLINDLLHFNVLFLVSSNIVVLLLLY